MTYIQVILLHTSSWSQHNCFNPLPLLHVPPVCSSNKTKDESPGARRRLPSKSWDWDTQYLFSTFILVLQDHYWIYSWFQKVKNPSFIFPWFTISPCTQVVSYPVWLACMLSCHLGAESWGSLSPCYTAISRAGGYRYLKGPGTYTSISSVSDCWKITGH